MYLTTPRLLLRPVEYMDIDQLVAIWADPEATRFLGGPRDPSLVCDMLDEEAESPSGSPFGQWPLIEKESGRVAGDCGLLKKEIGGAEEVELVYVIAPWAWGRGYASEAGEAMLRFAFDVLDLPRVVSLVHPDNERSRRVAEKLGMHVERSVMRPDGIERELWVRLNPER